MATYTLTFIVIRNSFPITNDELPLILTGVAATFAGVVIGKRCLHKVRIAFVQILTGIMLLGNAIALGTGII